MISKIYIPPSIGLPGGPGGIGGGGPSTGGPAMHIAGAKSAVKIVKMNNLLGTNFIHHKIIK
ncbi:MULTISPECIES: hypothetical protein [unclassified Flavobacterium]|uniref:hypothetical protein n=1 Tax=unclassified Flavobacterium TaxID=196869 RepID=UPI0025BC0804|nr:MULTISPECIES: hypothetical protein [unclassified Flavobacterium]